MGIGIEIDYELRLRQALKMSGYSTPIVGLSKIGKWILCQRINDFQHLVKVSGADFKNYLECWINGVQKNPIPYVQDLLN